MFSLSYKHIPPSPSPSLRLRSSVQRTSLELPGGRGRHSVIFYLQSVDFKVTDSASVGHLPIVGGSCQRRWVQPTVLPLVQSVGPVGVGGLSVASQHGLAGPQGCHFWPVCTNLAFVFRTKCKKLAKIILHLLMNIHQYCQFSSCKANYCCHFWPFCTKLAFVF